MPPRSSGCATCRRRRVRCDEARPGCDRCAKHGVVCPGYVRAQGVVHFEDQTASTAERANLRYLRTRNFGKILDSAEDSLVYFASPGSSGDNPYRPDDTLSLLPAQVQSPAANRAQFYDSLISLFNPRNVTTSSRGFDWMRVAALLAPSNPVLQNGLDTLSLIQLGSAHGDRRLLEESTVQYGKALRGTSRNLRHGGLSDDAVLATVSILALCEFFDHIKNNASGWLGHVAGVDQILLARGPASLNSKLSNILFFTSRHASLSRSLVIRKADPLDTPAWRAAIHRIPLGFASHWISLAMQIPTFLERLDSLNPDGDNALLGIEALLSDCERLDSEIEQWHVNWQQLVAPRGEPQYTLHGVQDFEPFASLIKDTTLLMGYRFPEHKTAHLHCQYWCCVWHLRRTLQSLYMLRQHALSPNADVEESPRATTIAAELDTLVFHICHCIPYFASLETGTQGQISMFLPLRVAIIHFRSMEMWEWLNWADTVRANIFTRGLSQPDITTEAVVIPRLSPLRNLEDTRGDPGNAVTGSALGEL